VHRQGCLSDDALGRLVDGDWLALDLAQARGVSDAGLAAALRQLPRLRALDLSGRAAPGPRSISLMELPPCRSIQRAGLCV